jgi:hypothetical protein
VLTKVAKNLKGGENYFNFLVTCKTFCGILNNENETIRKKLLFKIIFKDICPPGYKFSDFKAINSQEINGLVTKRKAERTGKLYRTRTVAVTNYIPFNLLIVVLVVTLVSIFPVWVYLSSNNQDCYDKCLDSFIQYQNSCEQRCRESNNGMFKTIIIIWICFQVSGMVITYPAIKDRWGAKIQNGIINISELVGRLIERIRIFMFGRQIFLSVD